MHPKVILVLSVILLAGCGTAPSSSSSATRSPSPATNATDAKLGSSFDSPVVIHADGEASGVAAEHAWIRANLPGGRMLGQWLMSHGDKMFDRIQIGLPDGSVREVYFDITGYFGKF